MQIGMLDQGFFPDGLYTAPTDEAMRFDLDMAKSLGYNMLRKHIKVEPDRWYHHADQIGILIWQVLAYTPPPPALPPPPPPGRGPLLPGFSLVTALFSSCAMAGCGGEG